MGYGDDIMATAIAKHIVQAHERDGQKVKAVFGNPENFYDKDTNQLRVHWSEVFENNPYIYQPNSPGVDLVCIPEYPGNRAYINYDQCDVDGEKITRFAWNSQFGAPPGEFYFTPDEKSQAAETCMRLPWPFFVIEPNVMDKPWANKKGWPMERWQAVVRALPEIFFIQMGQGAKLDGAMHVHTSLFRDAVALLSCSLGFAGTDGGLHHAAAAVGVPATVLWGHFTSPEILGYPEHLNVRKSTGIGCGTTYGECEGCGLGDIEVEEVVNSIRLMSQQAHLAVEARRDEAEEPLFRQIEGE